MIYHNVCLESFGYTLPEEIVTSGEIERRLEPLYQRLRLAEGRLELMTGIRQRRFWRRGARPSDKSVESAEKAIRAAQIDRRHIGALVHGSVCRDYLEPATACSVHHRLGLPERCLVYDVSNACLGLLNGVVQIANMIELGQIRAGIVVGSEDSRHLVEHTIETLNQDATLTRGRVKRVLASLTIGSGSCAMVMADRRLSQTGNRLLAATARASTALHHLCCGGDQTMGRSRPLMETDSTALMREGVAAGKETFQDFLAETGWTRRDLHKTFCHQVGAIQRKSMLATLRLPEENDYTTLEWLGNTGSVALPITMAHGLENGLVRSGENIGMLGIGSGINCLMVAANWRESRVLSQLDNAPRSHGRCEPLAELAANPGLAGSSRRSGL